MHSRPAERAGAPAWNLAIDAAVAIALTTAPGFHANLAAAQPPLATHPCAKTVARTLEAWDARTESVRAADGPLGSTALKLPTTRLGVWIVLQLRSDGSVRATRVGPRRSEHASWTSDCAGPVRWATDTRLPGARRTGAFTDLDLERTLQSVDRGVLLLWSPHMPLSISGFGSLGEATARLGIALVPLLDPLADADYASQTAAAEGLPPDSTRPVASVELTFRDLTTHAPSIQVFAHGRLVGEMLPGYRDPDYYLTFIARQLETAEASLNRDRTERAADPGSTGRPPIAR